MKFSVPESKFFTLSIGRRSQTERLRAILVPLLPLTLIAQGKSIASYLGEHKNPGASPPADGKIRRQSLECRVV
jgi:hypothetical protein